MGQFTHQRKLSPRNSNERSGRRRLATCRSEQNGKNWLFATMCPSATETCFSWRGGAHMTPPASPSDSGWRTSFLSADLVAHFWKFRARGRRIALKNVERKKRIFLRKKRTKTKTKLKRKEVQIIINYGRSSMRTFSEFAHVIKLLQRSSTGADYSCRRWSMVGSRWMSQSHSHRRKFIHTTKMSCCSFL